MLRELTTMSRRRDGRTTAVGFVIGALALLCSGAIAQTPRIAVIGGAAAPVWCDLLRGDGYSCDDHPLSGPATSLDDYRLVIDLTSDWTDAQGELEAVMRAGKGVITIRRVPLKLGINTDPVVQDWIGANSFAEGTNQMLTVATDPILGDLPVGTELIGFNASLFSALDDTTGHPGAKVLARYHGGTGKIGLMRNDWEGGTSVYFSGPIWPNNPLDKSIILSTVRELAPLPIPTVSQWGLTAAALLLVTAGSILIHRRRQTAS